MKKKEILLSFDTPLRFIFSHSALKEGWDNPNVFQICTLVENQDTMTKRQKVGRGLRLPVNQNGDRICDEQINILTVVANESYESFAENLQREIELDTNTKFGVVTERLFENILVKKEDSYIKLGYDDSKKIYDYLQGKGLIDKKGKASPELKEAIITEKLDLPEEFQAIAKDVISQIKETQKRLPILNNRDRIKVEINKQIYISPEFKELWDRIKYKTVYHLNFDSQVLIENCAKAVTKMDPVATNPVIGRWVDLHINKKGISADDPKRIRQLVREEYENKRLPDILLYIETHTRLKRRSIADILIKSNTLDSFYLNPQDYMQKVVEIINQEKRKIMVDGIKYEKIGEYEYYSQELFDSKELIGYLKENALAVSKSVYTHLVYDSNVEKSFAERLNNDTDVKLFAKLPSWFQIETPLGPYNPDWTILLDRNGEERLYFVVETKGSISFEDLRYLEDAKIQCGKKHFDAIGTGVIFERADSYDEWREKV
jgi:type III restriction enzyme